MEYLNDDQIRRILEDVVDLFLIPHFLSLGMDASGEWRGALHVVGDRIRGRKYTEQLVYGRKPGTFAPIEPLKKWAMLKLGLDEKQALGAAFAISNKLKNEGSEYYKQGGTTLVEILRSPEVVGFISMNAQRFIREQVTIEIRGYLRSTFK